MSEVLYLASYRPEEEIAAERFEAYRAASERAQRTLDLDDGLAAGRAWKAFLDVFVRRPRPHAVSSSAAQEPRH